ncbi:MAG: hypothetical protein Q4E57_10060 [Eubacteriales bacterium]|nr:hypothetical protein [Eubacteriales bacterium]
MTKQKIIGIGKAEGFFDKELIDFNYPEGDFHTMYIGEIIQVFCKEEE